jgi:mycothiol synthase
VTGPQLPAGAAGSPLAEDLARRLTQATLEALAVEDGTDVRMWAYQATPADDRRAAGLGLYQARELWQMRRPLPVPGADRRALPTRPFEVGRDEAAWLAVNNRAFGWHPDQSGWTLDDLRAREQEPWFDTAGFLLHEREGRLAGFCWTKVHRDSTPPMGEIYVIAVDPDWHGQGLGRDLTLAGLDHLAGAGLGTAMLYVESTNGPAIRLYRDMGFTVHRVDRVYRSLAPTG